MPRSAIVSVANIIAAATGSVAITLSGDDNVGRRRSMTCTSRGDARRMFSIDAASESGASERQPGILRSVHAGATRPHP
jgi:hypothetical protein